jgi:multiple sugar transport system ATP-binding protein
MANVELVGLGKRFGATMAVSGVDLTIGHGEFMVLLGPSGCGKSTTLRMIAGLEPISEGTLRIDGREMNRVPAKDRDIAMVFQSYALYPHMSVRENMAFGLRRRSFARAEIERRVTSAAGILGLDALLDRKPHALSGGQRQRVAVGRAIVREPKVFLFDEPLSNLDAALRVSMRAELIALHRRLGCTIVYVTHDQVEAMTMGTRICVMRGGRVEQIGKPIEVYRRPANAFVARFLGNPPMNLLPVHPARREGGRTSTLVFGNTIAKGTVPPHWPADGKNVLLGVRPEDIEHAPQGVPDGRIAIQVKIETVESLGAETIIGASIAGVPTPLVARLGRDCVLAPGDETSFAFAPSAIHWFDGSSDGRLVA